MISNRHAEKIIIHTENEAKLKLWMNQTPQGLIQPNSERGPHLRDRNQPQKGVVKKEKGVVKNTSPNRQGYFFLFKPF